MLVESAKEALRRGWTTYSSAMNSNDFNAAAGAMRSILGAVERIAKLSGLDSERLAITLDQQEIDEDTDALLATHPAVNAIGAMRAV